MSAVAIELALDPKRLSSCRARTALWGGQLVLIEGDDGRPLLIVSRWALCKSFDSFDGVEQFLQRVGA